MRVAAVLLVAALVSGAAEKKNVNILFVGNSLTYGSPLCHAHLLFEDE